MAKITDISLPIYQGMPVYPGTSETEITSTKSTNTGSSLSEIKISSHVGTHIDASSHVIAGGPTIDKFNLEIFYGPCRVLDMTNCPINIDKQDLEDKNIQAGERILLKTKNSERDWSKFFEDYIFLTPEAALFLAEQKIKLVGIDALSVKQKGNPDNTPHSALLSKNIPIIEGLNLNGVNEGEYTLIAFPLNFRSIDGSPTRAVLFTDDLIKS